MSDFLTDLVARNLGVADVIQPRLPSLFEPPPSAPDARRRSREGEDTSAAPVPDQFALANRAGRAARQPAVDGTQDAVSGNVRTGHVSPPRARANLVAVGNETSFGYDVFRFATVEPGSPPRPATDLEQFSETATAGGSPTREVDTANPIAVPEAHVTVDGPVSHVPTRATRIPATTKIGADRPEALAAPPTAVQPATPFLAADDRDLPPETRTVRPQAPAIDVLNRGTSQATETATARSAGRSVGAALQAASHGPTEVAQKSEPTIHVTIGRIEVRATPAPAEKPPRRKPSPPVMTLEEYLRRR